MLNMGRHVISYHYPCPDGVFAALAANQHFKAAGTAGVQFFPNKVFSPVKLADLSLTRDDTLYMLDYVGPAGFALEACSQAGRVILLDHHKTAIDEYEGRQGLPGNLENNLDISHSGATIALKYFQPQVNERQDQLFRFIEDADLWKWRLKDSKLFYAGFAALGFELDVNKNEGIFDQLLDLDPADVIAKGRIVQADIDRRIAQAISTATIAQIGGVSGQQNGFGKCLLVQAGNDSGLSGIRSQLGNALAAESKQRGLRAVGLIAYREPEMPEGEVKCSLRSIGEEDTTVISKAYGGGGHLNASSFIINKDDFSSWVAQP